MGKQKSFHLEFRKNGGNKNDTYPTKRKMNLYYKEDRTTWPATVALYVLFVIVVLIGLAKVLVYDRMVAVNDLKDQYGKIESQIANYQSELSDFEEIQNQYFRYSATEEEENQIDRMELLNLIDSAIRSSAKVQSVQIQDHVVLVQFSGITLSNTAGIVEKLETSELVESIQVDTASTTETNSNVVNANLYINLAGNEEKEEQ